MIHNYNDVIGKWWLFECERRKRTKVNNLLKN